MKKAFLLLLFLFLVGSLFAYSTSQWEGYLNSNRYWLYDYDCSSDYPITVRSVNTEKQKFWNGTVYRNIVSFSCTVELGVGGTMKKSTKVFLYTDENGNVADSASELLE